MTTKYVTLSSSRDYTNLGPDATAEDLDRYCANLAAAIEEKFGVSVHQVQCDQQASHRCQDDAEIDSWLREMVQTDEWGQYLD